MAATFITTCPRCTLPVNDSRHRVSLHVDDVTVQDWHPRCRDMDITEREIKIWAPIIQTVWGVWVVPVLVENTYEYINELALLFRVLTDDRPAETSTELRQRMQAGVIIGKRTTAWDITDTRTGQSCTVDTTEEGLAVLARLRDEVRLP